MSVAEHPVSTETKLKKIMELSKSAPDVKFKNLIHLVNKESLISCFHELDGKKAVGADGVDKDTYGRDLEKNVEDLTQRMRKMAYRPGPVRTVLIPKEGKPGATRPLGIGNLEDKLVQSMFRKILESVYEPKFLDCSFGFRPGKGCHDAIKELQNYLMRNSVKAVIDVDLKNFFGTINHKKLIEIVGETISDEVFLRYIVRMFKGGVLTDGELTISDEGVPQGSPCSPVLANVMAHHVIDCWFKNVVRPHSYGRVSLVRYADDLVICVNDVRDGARILKALGQRLNKFDLQLNEEKTRIVRFSKIEAELGIEQETFDFLGFTFYIGKSRKGRAIPKLSTSGKRTRSKLAKVKEWCVKVTNRYQLTDIWRTFCAKIRGHINYYAVSHNIDKVIRFVRRATMILFKWLNRRSQKKSISREAFEKFMQANPLPTVTVKVPLFTPYNKVNAIS